MTKQLMFELQESISWQASTFLTIIIIEEPVFVTTMVNKEDLSLVWNNQREISQRNISDFKTTSRYQMER